MPLDNYARTGHIRVHEKYRLYADGMIMNQETNSIAGYITNRVDLDEIWSIKSIKEQQIRLKEYII